MPSRCGSCENCMVVETNLSKLSDYTTSNKKRREKARKRIVKGRACTGNDTDNEPLPKKMKRIAEADQLAVHTAGGRMIQTIPQDAVFAVSNLPKEDARAKPEEGSMMLPTYSKADVDLYQRTVTECETVGKNTASNDIADEYSSITKKLREPLAKSTDRDEIDWTDATRTAQYILLKWKSAHPVGNSVFEMSMKLQEKEVEELKTFLTDVAALYDLREKYFDSFEDEASNILEEVCNRIPPNTGLNTVLAFMKFVFHKATTSNVDLSSNNIFQWFKRKYDKSNSIETTEKQSSPDKLSSAQTAWRQMFIRREGIESSSENPIEHPSSNKGRISKQQRIGSEVKDGLCWAGVLRRHGLPKEADLIVSGIRDDDFEALPARTLKDCTEAAQTMETVLFKGGIRRIMATLRSFRDRPAVREVLHQTSVATLNNDQSVPGETKDETLNRELRKSVRAFLKMFTKRRGRVCLEDQNALDAAIAALAGDNIKEKGLQSTLRRALGISQRLLKRATKLRKALEDKDDKHWIRVPPKEYSNAIKDSTRRKLTELLHTDEFSQTDNMNKREYLVVAGITAQGQTMYDLHEARRLTMNKEEIFDKLTGRNRMDPSKPNDPHPVWQEIQRETSGKNRENGIKGSMKLLKQCMCPCLRQNSVHFCSCDICVAAEESVRHYKRSRFKWQKQHIARRKKEAEERGENVEGGNQDRFGCRSCNMICCTDGVYRNFSVSAKTSLETILCDAVLVPELALPKLDMNGNKVADKRLSSSRFKRNAVLAGTKDLGQIEGTIREQHS